MPLLIALAISIGLLAIVATWLFLGPLAALGLQIWQAFVAWASHYHSGGKVAGMRNTIVCMSFGALVGALSVMLAGQLGTLGALSRRLWRSASAPPSSCWPPTWGAVGHDSRERLWIRLCRRADPAQGCGADGCAGAHHRLHCLWEPCSGLSRKRSAVP